MAATEILAIGTAAADATEVAVVAGTPVTVALKQAASGPVDSRARCTISYKGSGSLYIEFGALDGQNPVRTLDSPGTYRISRVSTGASVGVDRE